MPQTELETIEKRDAPCLTGDNLADAPFVRYATSARYIRPRSVTAVASNAIIRSAEICIVRRGEVVKINKHGPIGDSCRRRSASRSRRLGSSFARRYWTNGSASGVVRLLPALAGHGEAVARSATALVLVSIFARAS